ncbi:ribonucleotide reductase subunit alpha [Caldimonas sp. KR1-144]|uniref:ribonucleotide reductase subunit alpha n=1 Tax=Caldimonas sp. KR1-144 TaxID=3400911 RepID=UPI003C08F67A
MDDGHPFDQLLAAAAAQPDRQVLLFVFAAAQLPSDATPAQRDRYDAGAGGELTPLMCVEKPLDELTSFEALVSESRDVGPPWQVVFVAGLGGHGDEPPSPRSVESSLHTMIERVKHGAVQGLLALSPRGEVLTFE